MTRQVRIDINRVNRLRVRGTGRWADFGEPWLCAHDLLHHKSGDKGSFQEELQTFGTELWMSNGKDIETALSFTAVAATIEDTRNPTSLGKQLKTILTQSSPAQARALLTAFTKAERQNLKKFLDEGVKEGMGALKEEFADKVEKAFGPGLYDTLYSETGLTRMAEHVAVGYVEAKNRYPDAKASGVFFRKLEYWLGSVSNFEVKSIAFELDEKRLTLTTTNRAGREAWEAVQEQFTRT